MIKTELKDLKESNEFLNLLLDNINSAILIADDTVAKAGDYKKAINNLDAANSYYDSFLNLFDHAANGISGKGFGEVTGCVNAVIENKPCGETSHCAHCLLRKSLVRTLVENAPIDRQHLERTFYLNGKPGSKASGIQHPANQFPGAQHVSGDHLRYYRHRRTKD